MCWFYRNTHTVCLPSVVAHVKLSFYRSADRECVVTGMGLGGGQTNVLSVVEIVFMSFLLHYTSVAVLCVVC